ncbi:MAG TPA: hypothetical protein DC049_12080, partial [Spirochaetia bacterium]|nr:hypothetical protein [Spirochaetia bacterium]
DPRHKEKFKNIGRAHVYLVTRCYEYLRKKNQPVSISMVPLVYTDPLRADDEGKIYLQELKELPAGVKIIIVETKKESLDYFKILTGRYPVLWSNFLAHYENTKALVFPPFSDGGREIDKLCHGYYFLPVMPLKEDFRGMSWLCAADYLWQPAEYNPEISFQKASSLMFSASIGGILKEFSDYKNRVFSTATQPNYPVYGNTKTEKIDYCRKVMADFLQFRNKIKNAEFGNLAENLIQEINTYQTQWELIIKEIEYRDFPCQAASFTPVLAGRDEEKNIISKSSQIQDLWLVKTMNPPNAKTAFYLSYDSSNIYITAFCSEPAVDKIIAVKTEKDSEVFSDDCIEIFLGPKAAVFMPYYHFAVNSLGIVFDEEVRSGAAELDQPDTKIMEKKWNAEAKTAAWKWSGGWAVQIKIPVKDMGVQLITSGLRWRFNVGRVRYGAQKEFSALAYLPAGQFHTPERFAILEFK